MTSSEAESSDRLAPWIGESRASAWPDGWILLDRAGRIVGYNLRFFELWGLSDEEIAALRAADPDRRGSLLMNCTLARAKDPETAAAGIRRQTGLPEEVTFDDVALEDGRILERYGVPLRDDAGRVLGRAVSLRDVTARRRAEIELRERARQQEAIAEVGKAVVGSSDVDTLLQETLRIIGQTVGADVAHFFELSDGGARLTLRSGFVIGLAEPEPVDPARSPAALAAARRSTVVVHDLASEQRFVPAGHAHNYRAGVSVVVRGRVRTFGVLCVHWKLPRGVTEDEVHFLETVADFLTAAFARFQAEAQILERERGIRAVFDASLDGLLTFGDDGVVIDANPAAARIFHRAPGETLGRHLFTLFGDEAREQCEAKFGTLMETGRCSGEQELRSSGHPARLIEYAAVASILPGRHLIVLRDVTERHQMHARLALADRMASVGTLAAGVAHELNNPLSYVTANLSYVAESLRERTVGAARAPAAPAEELVQAVEEARQGAAKMRAIIQGLRTFSRGDEERTGPVELGPVLESCVSMAWNEIKHRARFVRRLEDVPPVLGNEARLGQVFLNLLVNAAQAIADGGADRNSIVLATRRVADGRVSVEVSDSGCGIPPEIRSRIFDPFFTTKRIGVGTGLGLSICHSIVSSLGGSIDVESAPGKGATFRVLLPAAAAMPAPPPSPASAAPRPPRGRILVVDDEPLVIAAVRRALEPEHDVAVASCAKDALGITESSARFDLIVSDLHMPQMTGMDLYAELSERDPALSGRMVFLTGGAFTPAARAFVEEHADSCMEKPFDPPAIREFVKQRMVERAVTADVVRATSAR